MRLRTPTSDRSTLSPVDRRALLSIVVQFFINGAVTASFVSRSPEIRDRIGVSVGQFGLLMTLAGAFGVLSSMFAGRIVERLSTRRVLIFGGAIAVLALPLIGLASTAPVYLVAVSAFMFCDVLIDISMNLQGSWISARRHVPVMNRLHGVWSVGALIGGLGAAQASAAGLSLVAHLSIVGIVAVGLLVLVVRGLLPEDEERHADAAPVDAAAIVGRARFAPLAVLVMAGVTAIVMEQAGGDWATFRLTDDFGASDATASLAFVAFMLGMSIARIGGDFAQVGLGRETVHRVSLVAATVGLAVASLVPNQRVVMLGFGLTGLGVATFLPKLYDDAARVPGRPGAGLGAMTSGTQIARLAVPSLIGVLAGTGLSVGSAIAIVALPSAIAFAALTVRPR
jgi:predicted MFS family arabinose efflux permease